MTTPWTPLLGDIGAPGSINALTAETAARIAADNALQAEISAIAAAPVSSVFGRVGAVVKQAGDYNFSDLGSIPNTVGGYGITDFNSLGDARWLQLAGGTLTGPVVHSYTDTGIVSSPIPIFSLINYNPSGTSSRSPIAIAGQVTLDGSQDMSNVNSRSASFSATSAVLSTRTAPTFGLYGYKALVQKQNTNTLSWMVGANLSTDNRGGVVSNQINYYAFSQILSGATATILAGFYVDLPFTQAGATITTLYGLYIEDATGIPATVGQKWGVFVKGAVPNFFGGSVAAASFSGDGSALTSLGFGHIAGLPTTIAGYGITDFNSLGDVRWSREGYSTVIDTVSRANNAGSAGSAETGQAYVVWAGTTWGVSGNRIVNATTAAFAVLVLDSGSAEQDWTVNTMTSNAAITTMGLIVRGKDASNYIQFVLIGGTQWRVYKTIGGVSTLYTSGGFVWTSNTLYTLRATAFGGFLVFSVNGVVVYSTMELGSGDLPVQDGTFVGYYANAGGANNNIQTFWNANALFDPTRRFVPQAGTIGATIGSHMTGGVQRALTLGSAAAGIGDLMIWGGSITMGRNLDTIIAATHLRLRNFQGVDLGSTAGAIYFSAATDTAVMAYQKTDVPAFKIQRFSAGTVSDLTRWLAEDGTTVLASVSAAGNLTVPTRINLAGTITPSGSADSQGATRDIVADDNFIYAKTSVGWKRAALSTF